MNWGIFFRFTLPLIAVFFLTASLSYWISKYWTLHYFLLAPFILFPCLWISGSRKSNMKIKLASVSVLIGFIVPFLIHVRSQT